MSERSTAGDAPAEVTLLEPARLRLIEIAADVLGTLASEDVPPPLRAVARFTPGKRARLGATALASTLDADEDFRGRVADLVTESSPLLVQAVRENAPTPAADPLDTAITAYLIRPDGWQDIVSAANERYVAARQHRAAGAAELTRLRDDNAALRARLKAETARLRTSEVEIEERANAELAELRRRVRTQGREIREAQRERDDALAARSEALERAAAADSAHEAEVRRLRARITDLERAGESARRSVRVDRDLDDARLWLLVDTLTEAASGIRRELSLPTPNRRPADSVTAAEPTDPERTIQDPAALDRLLGMPNAHLIVDGYNVTKTGYGELALADQRQRLVSSLAPVAGRSGAEITIAFDGGERPPAQPPVPRGVRVLFSAADEIADDLIRRLVAAEPAGRPVIVATSDRQVVADTRRAGAWAVASAVLLARLDAAR